MANLLPEARHSPATRLALWDTGCQAKCGRNPRKSKRTETTVSVRGWLEPALPARDAERLHLKEFGVSNAPDSDSTLSSDRCQVPLIQRGVASFISGCPSSSGPACDIYAQNQSAFAFASIAVRSR